MDNACKILTLQSIKGVGAKAIASLPAKELVEAADVKAFYTLLKSKFEKNKRIMLPDMAKLEQLVENNRQLLMKSMEQGIQAYTFLDPDFPVFLNKLAQPCQLLFVKGNAALLQEKAIAIIGTREISPLGEKVGRHFAKYVVDKGWVVVSGLALGCDTSGHRGCLEAGGKTIAVLAGGLDSIYPKQNTPLAEEIIKTDGCLISEYPIGVSSNPYRLIARDRLQSGLASGVMVVETGEKSGTMHAVNHALAAKKPIGCCDFDKFAPDHCDTHIHAMGNRMLIEQGKAQGLYDKGAILDFLQQCEDYYSKHQSRPKRVSASAEVSLRKSIPEASPKEQPSLAKAEQLKLF